MILADFAFTLQRSAKAEQVIYQLLNGDSISGKLLKGESTNDLKVILHKHLGKIEIKSSDILLPKTNPWNGNIEVGLDGSSTTSSNSLGYLLEINAKYKEKAKELNLNTRYDFKKTSKSGKEDITAIKKAFTKVRLDSSLKDRWTSYLSTSYEYNELNKVGVNDISTSAGVAYKLIETSKAILLLSAGPSLDWINGGVNCSKESSCGDIRPGASFGSNFEASISQNIELLIQNTFNAELARDSYKSNKFLTAIRFFPSNKSSLYTSFSYENIFDEIKEPSQEHVYKLNLGTKF
ncbi:DUF481 domain-containing protein [Prochlorococcus sp. MIT 1341]|uniref:DUF481 domain-containing protein n=1 Tax=Prochlorococcus sp. MIT 1341 TaxID=3096221 RepID=UPI002A758939|nr:DUF481 domain-containing protein [Prochlorococcus sp. MIT 1341]